MKAHNGKILIELLDALGVKKGKLAAILGIHHNNMTNLSDSFTIPNEKLLQISEIINLVAEYSNQIGKSLRIFPTAFPLGI